MKPKPAPEAVKPAVQFNPNLEYPKMEYFGMLRPIE